MMMVVVMVVVLLVRMMVLMCGQTTIGSGEEIIWLMLHMHRRHKLLQSFVRT